MLLRVIFVSLLLGASIFIQVRQTRTYFGHIQTFHYILIAIVYFLTFVYVVILKYGRGQTWFVYLQLIFDTFFITAVVYTTGGIESLFSSLYFLPIIYSSIILYRRGGMILASSSSILYGLLLDLHYYGVIRPLGSRVIYSDYYQSSYLFYMIIVNTAAFYVVAYLSSYVSEQAMKSRVALRAKQVDVDKLEILNESIINSITSGLIAIDEHERIILFNPAAEEIFGLRAGDVFGRPAREVLPFFDRLSREEISPDPVLGGPASPFRDIPYPGPGGGNLWLRLSVSPLRLPLGKKGGRILILQDLTQIRKIEEEMKKVEGLAMIGELAAGIAHEIRNPLASISGSIQMLRDGLEKDTVHDRLMEITCREVDRLNRLVNDFLLFARPRKTDLKSFDINELITEALELFIKSPHWTEEIEISTDLCDSFSLESDPGQLKQVLWNLFLNARDAMPGGGTLSVITSREEDAAGPGRDRIRIIIRDTGAGFDEKVLSQLFVPFFTTKEGGSGLGLAIVKRIVEGLGGRIIGRNYPGGGAEIVMTFPMSLTPLPEKGPEIMMESKREATAREQIQ